MTDFYISHSTFKPDEWDVNSGSNLVFQRRNFQLISVNDDELGSFSYWKYEERTMSFAEYDKFKIASLEDELTSTQLALTELYESLLEG